VGALVSLGALALWGILFVLALWRSVVAFAFGRSSWG